MIQKIPFQRTADSDLVELSDSSLFFSCLVRIWRTLRTTAPPKTAHITTAAVTVALVTSVMALWGLAPSRFAEICRVEARPGRKGDVVPNAWTRRGLVLVIGIGN